MTFPTETHVSDHLSLAELACKDGTPYPSEWVESRALPLAAVFEAIRVACGGKPITVTSAYRTPAHNARIGGERQSQHLEGRALDLKPPAHLTISEFYQRIRRLVDTRPDLNIGGLGRYPGFVHVDIRPTASLVVWLGHGLKDDRA